MIDFESSFIGVPLPNKYEGDFLNLLTEIRQISPLAKLVDCNTPHITLYYLGKQNEKTLLGEIRNVVESNIDVIRGKEIHVGGSGMFIEDTSSRVLYLGVNPMEPLQEFVNKVSIELNRFYPRRNNLTFIPHMTVAELDQTDQKPFQIAHKKIENRLDGVNWKFSIPGVMIYGHNFVLKDLIPYDFKFNDNNI